MRTHILAVVALVVGLTAGIVAGQMMKSSALEKAARDAKEALDKADKYASEREKLQKQIALLREENASLNSDLADAQGKLASVPEPQFGIGQEAADMAMLDEALEGVGDEAAPEERQRWRPPGMSEEDAKKWREQMEERRKEWQDMQEQRDQERRDFVDQAITGAKDVNDQNRMAAIEDFSTTMREQMMSLRTAETEEERAAIMGAIRENAQTMNRLVNAQQDEMIRDLAGEYGISSKEDQQAFVSAFRDMQQTPFFQDYEFVSRMSQGFADGGMRGFGRPGRGPR